MHSRTAGLFLSASDIANHLACRHLTSLDRMTAEKRLEPPQWKDPLLEVLKQRGFHHENTYLEHLQQQSTLSIVRISDMDPDQGDSAFERTRAAMRAGADVIVQATLESGRWYGRADVLRKVETPSQLGNWSYEVVDTKLARDTRAGTILQLCFYSEIVAEIQGIMPARMHVVAPGTDFKAEVYRLDDYLAYYRFVKARLEETVAVRQGATGSGQTGASSSGSMLSGSAPTSAKLSRLPGSSESAQKPTNGTSTYPNPTLQCDICRWWPHCDRQRRQDDHLCLVAGMGRLQQRELQSWGVETLSALAGLPVPLERRPQRGSRETYERLREQARLQLETRCSGKLTYELLRPMEADQGLARLPEPSRGDVFLDIEGDPFAGTSGMDYLFGYATLEGSGGTPGIGSNDGTTAVPTSTSAAGAVSARPAVAPDGAAPTYHRLWALTPAGERASFETLMKFLLDRWERFPDMHIYHYAPYEPSAFKRLMGRHGTQEDAVDRLLRAERFVDLHAVVKRALRAGVEKYSIKDLEPLFGFQRVVELRQASASLRALEYALELGDTAAITDELRATVEFYNRDDCVSALRLRDWLEERRRDLVAQGEDIPRPAPKDGDPSTALDDRRQRVQALTAALTHDVPVALDERTPEQHARWLLAQMLEWHRREAKAPWWEYFRLIELTDEELLEERAAIAGLKFESRLEIKRRIPTDRYAYPPQETQILRNDEVRTPDGENFGKVLAIDVVARTIDLRKTKKTAEVHPSAIFAHPTYNTKVQEDALIRLGEWVAEHGIDAEGPYRAARDLLLRLPPRVGSPAGTPLQDDSEPTLDAARRLALALDESVLPVQGPPGSGKTYAGARMIVELVRHGKKVGVTAVSHAVIRNLLDAVEEAAREAHVELAAIQKTGDDFTHGATNTIRITDENREVEEALRQGTAEVAGGTSWLWSRPEFFESVDVLVVDEAGQMSLANVLAVAQAARSVILIGDPQQLEQPQKGTHPDGADTSALEHLIRDPLHATSHDGVAQQTVPRDRGLFLGETWRLHPSICAFTSELFYEGRLRAHAGLERQAIAGPTPFAGAGLWFVPVAHEGNRSSSTEEVDALTKLVESLAAPGVSWVNTEGKQRPLTLEDILIVAPYNAQVAAIRERIPGADVGTVDKFQGQEAPVVIYSMATSSSDEAPRGMEFLYSLNRLNVATSRARGACILVANPTLLEPECRTPRQVCLANAFCRYLERVEEATYLGEASES